MSFWKLFGGYIERGYSVLTDFVVVGLACIALFTVLCLVFSVTVSFGAAIISAVVAVFGGAFYMRARLNLIDPAPAYRNNLPAKK